MKGTYDLMISQSPAVVAQRLCVHSKITSSLLEDWRDIWPEIANFPGTQLVHVDCNSDIKIQTYQQLSKKTSLLAAIRKNEHEISILYTVTTRQSQPICSSCVRYPCRHAIRYKNKDNEEIDTDDHSISSSSNSDEESENDISDDSINDFPTEIPYWEKMSFDDHCNHYGYI